MFLCLCLSLTHSHFFTRSLFSLSLRLCLSLLPRGLQPAVAQRFRRRRSALRVPSATICHSFAPMTVRRHSEPAQRSCREDGPGARYKKRSAVPAISEATWGHRARAGGREAAACVSLSLPPSVSGNRRSTTTARLAGMEAADLEEADPPVDEAMAPGRAEVSPAASPSLVVPSLLPSHLLSLPISTCHVCLFSVPAA